MARRPSPAKTATRRSAGKKQAAKKARAKAAPAKKSASRPISAKGAAVKKAAPRRGAKTRPGAPAKATRPVRAVAPARRKAAARGNAPRETVSQRFVVSHLTEADFKADGLRPYAQYRDLGFAEATGGLCQAHVIRLVPPCTDTVRQRHSHAVDLQLVYVLKGWVKNEFAGQGEQMMSVGSCWLQPSDIAHTVLDYSPDCELLEIVVPADFKTTERA